MNNNPNAGYGDLSPSGADGSPLNAPGQFAGGGAVVFPEVYYKLQPHVLHVCDQLDAWGVLPTKEAMDDAAENIYSQFLGAHPEMAAYDNNPSGAGDGRMPEARAAVTYGYGPGGRGGYGYGSGGGFRGRNVLRDIIDILLLSEFYRRRRRPYY